MVPIPQPDPEWWLLQCGLIIYVILFIFLLLYSAAWGTDALVCCGTWCTLIMNYELWIMNKQLLFLLCYNKHEPKMRNILGAQPTQSQQSQNSRTGPCEAVKMWSCTGCFGTCTPWAGTRAITWTRHPFPSCSEVADRRPLGVDEGCAWGQR